MRDRRSQLAIDQAEHMNPAAMRFSNDLSDLRKTDKSGTQRNLLGKVYDDFGVDDEGDATSGRFNQKEEDEINISSPAATQPVRHGYTRRDGAGGRAINDTAIKVRGAANTRKD